MTRDGDIMHRNCVKKAWWFDTQRAQAAADRMRARHGDGCRCLVYACPMGRTTRGDGHLHIGHLRDDPCKNRGKA